MGKLKKVPKISISFKKTELYLREYIEGKRDVSCYIKDLVERDMKNNGKLIDGDNSNINNNNFGLDF